MEIEMLKTLIILIVPPPPPPSASPFFYLLTNDHLQWDILNKMYILSTFSKISLPFYEVHLIRMSAMNNFVEPWTTFWFSQNLLGRALKNKFSPSSLFFPFDTVLSTLNNQGISCFNKNNWYVFVMFITCALFNVVWLDSF